MCQSGNCIEVSQKPCGPCSQQGSTDPPSVVPTPVLPVPGSDDCPEGFYSADCMVLTHPVVDEDGHVLVPTGSHLSDILRTLFDLVQHYQPHFSPGNDPTSTDSTGIVITGGQNGEPFKIAIKIDPTPGNPLEVGPKGLNFVWNPTIIKSLLSSIAGSSDLTALFCQQVNRCGYDPDPDPDQEACLPPINLSEVGITKSGVTLKWQNSGDILPVSYNLQYKLRSESQYTDLGELSVAPQNTDRPAYSLYQLTPNTVYDWRVRRNCSSSQSSDWATHQFTTAADLTPPAGCGTASNLIITF